MNTLHVRLDNTSFPSAGDNIVINRVLVLYSTYLYKIITIMNNFRQPRILKITQNEPVSL